MNRKKESKVVPNVRFKGFTDDWKQRKLSEIADKVTEKNAGLQYIETFTNSAEFGIISQRDFFDHDIAKMSSLGGYYIVRNEDFVYNPRISTSAPVGPINRNKLGRTGVMSPLYTVFRPHDVDITYLEYFFKSKYWNSFMNFNGDSGARSDRFSIKDSVFFEMPIPLPYIEEQRKIGEHLTQLDCFITLHQQKITLLIKLKKAMLEKMFPKKGTVIPEIRFNGFANAWEQRKLGDIVERVTRKNQNIVSDLPLTISAQYGLIDQNEFFDKRVASKDVSGYYLIYNGEFAYNKSISNDAPWGAIKRLDRYENGVLSTLYIVFKIKNEEKTNSDFIATYYDTNIWHKDIKAIAAEGARNHGLLNITPADFFETKLKFPKNVLEQQKIGIYFGNIDHLITLHQRKLDMLKKLKSACLNEMFI